MTGQPWLVAAEGGGGAETLAERASRADDALRAEVLADSFVRQVMQVFPGAELTEVRQIPPPQTGVRPPRRRGEGMKGFGELMKQAQAMQEEDGGGARCAGRPSRSTGSPAPAWWRLSLKGMGDMTRPVMIPP